MSRRGLKLQFLFVLCTIFCDLAGQPPSLYFEKLTTQNGLSHNKVNSILQDQRGFMWFGTDDGLNRYDGNNFLIFKNQPGTPYTISGNIITDIVEDKDGILWISTADGGLTKYNYRLNPGEQFKQFKHQPNDTNSIPVNILNALLEDQDGYLWIASSGSGVLRFDKKKETFLKIPLGKTSTCLDLALDKNGIIWVGRQGGGILKINPRSMQTEMDNRYLNLYAKLPHPTVTSLYRDSEQNIWYGSWDNVLYRYNTKKSSEEIFSKTTSLLSFGNDEVLSFAEDKKARLWIGGRYYGLHLFDRKQNSFYNFKYDPAREGTIADNRVNTIFIDRSGSIWLGTNKGISINNPAQQQFHQTFLPSLKSASPVQIIIYDFYKDEQGNLLIGTNAGIFSRRVGESALIHKPLMYNGKQLSVTKFFKDSNGTMWIGTDYSLFSYDVTKHSIKLLPNTEKDRVMNKMIASRVVSVVKDSIEGNPILLVSPYGHFLTYYDLVEKNWVSRLDSSRKIIANFNLRDNLIRKIYKTSSGKIWLATAKEGLGEWTKHSLPKVYYYKNNPVEKDGLSNNDVYDIAEDSLGNLWVSTYGGGLNYFNQSNKKITHIDAPHNLLEGLQVDRNGNIWIIGNGNIHKYDPKSKSYTTFELPDLEKSGGVRGYIYRDSKGRLYVAGTNYFIEFDPDSVQVFKNKPKVYFSDFRIFNDSYNNLLFKEKITLKHNQNYFTIEFAAPDFSSPIQYSYKLEGIDDAWVQAGARNFAPYSNLPGGDYIFKVRATNDPGSWTDEVASIKITIVPPFWKRDWFYILCAALIAGIIYSVYRYRISELLKRQAIRNKIAQDLHDNMGSTLSSISVYSQVAKIQNAKGNHKVLDEVLQKIASTSSDMISEMNDIVWAINPRNDSMEKILQRMESFAKPLLAAKNMRFSFTYDQAVLEVNLEMTKRKNFYLIFKETVNNALKYSGASQLTVDVKVKANHLELVVQDNGKGFSVEKVVSNSSQTLAGNGLRNMEMRAKEMQGSCIIKSGESGTCIVLRFPIP